MTPKQEATMVFREIKVGEYVLRFWPSDNGWMCGITPEMMQALTEPKEKYQYGTPLLDAMTGKTEQPEHVAAVNTSSERVAKQAQNVHEQPAQQGPVAWVDRDGQLVWNNREAAIGRNLYTSPQPSKPWVGLTNNEIALLNADYQHPQGFTRAIEAKLKERNT